MSGPSAVHAPPKDVGRPNRDAPAGGAARPARRKWRWSTLVLAACTLGVVAASMPDALADAHARGGIYLFSRAFVEDLPRRLTGPGRLRFLIQPTIAILLGWRAGLVDRRSGRPTYLMMIAASEQRRQALGETIRHVADLVLMGILIDMISQWLMLGVAHPGAALIIGPILIGLPYGIARGLTNRAARIARP